MNFRQLRRIIWIFAVLFLIVGSVYTGMKLQEKRFEASSIINSKSKATNKKDIQQVEKVKDIIQTYYIEDIDDETLIEGALKGMLDTLDDPYSTFMDEENSQQFEEQMESSFEGIGAEVGMENGQVTIIAPIQNTPAEKAGLRPRDKILQIDGKSTDSLDLMEAVDLIRGEKDTTVTLKIERSNVTEPFEVEVVRDEIPIETVYSDIKKENKKKTGIIELTNFSENTADDFQEELSNLEDEGIDGLIIDVRGNPGGLLDAVEKILNHFVPKNIPYVQIEDKDGKKDQYYSTLDEKKDYPIVVLTDTGSASASEILAVALKELDYDVVGEKTYGKGTVQQAVSISENTMVKLTSFKWLSPKGNWIHEKGVEPTYEVKQPKYYYTHPIDIDKEYKYDDTDENIKSVQIMLNGLGYKVDREDGYFSKKTQEAIKKFQKENDLSITGKIDQDTAQSLEVKVLDKIRNKEEDLQLEKALEVLYK